jgi:pyrroloquinoline quinone biosynthesis protein B
MRYLLAFFLGPALLLGKSPAVGRTQSIRQTRQPFIVVLGVAQDAGIPHPGCNKACCARRWDNPSQRKRVSSIGLIDPTSGERWLFDATLDLTTQMHDLESLSTDETSPPRTVSGIFLTHAHIGHYSGLMYLGREGLSSNNVPVFAMPRMKNFLETNGPWSQLVSLKNIRIHPLAADSTVRLNAQLRVTPIRVPHRDEFSETVGFRVQSNKKSLLYIPDIDKWERWDRNIEELIGSVDVALLDGTFFADGEISGRSMSEIPHPFIEESLKRFAALPPSERRKIVFIHLNHTNPALERKSKARREIERRGMRVAEEGERFGL